MKLTIRFLILLVGFSVVVTAFAIFNGRDPFATGGPIAATLAAFFMVAPFVVIVDLVRLWRARGQTGGSMLRRP